MLREGCWPIRLPVLQLLRCRQPTVWQGKLCSEACFRAWSGPVQQPVFAPPQHGLPGPCWSKLFT